MSAPGKRRRSLAMDSGSDSDEQPRTFTATFDEEYSLDPRKQEARPKDIIAITSSDDDDGLFLQGGVRRYFLEDSGPTCFNCGLTGHVSKECPESLVFDAVFCRICRATCAAKSAISVPGVARNAALIAVNRVTCSRCACAFRMVFRIAAGQGKSGQTKTSCATGAACRDMSSKSAAWDGGSTDFRSRSERTRFMTRLGR